MNKSAQPIIVRRVKKAAHAHHGGAWKIAYADFVTAMMAFFLLMWLISMTTQEQKIGLAEYFSPGVPSPTASGAGGVLNGNAPDEFGNRSSGARVEQAQRGAPPVPRDVTRGTGQEGAQARASDREVGRPTAGVQARHSAVVSLRQALQDMPEISELSRNIVIEPTKEGVNVSFVDQDGRSQFPDGSVQPYDRTRRVLEKLAPTLRRMPNRVAITGHTAALKPGTRAPTSPWDVSAGRAITVREILAANGVPNDRFTSVAGKADTEPLYPDNPYVPPNRRVTITLLSEEPPLATSFSR